MTVNEGRVSIALAAKPRHAQIAGTPLTASAVLADTLWRGALLFLPLALTAILGFYILYHAAARESQEALQANQAKLVELGRATANATLNSIAAEIAVLAEDGVLKAWLNSGDPALKGMLAQEFLTFVSYTPRYDQVRFIDLDGRERIRVDRPGGAARIAPDDELENKAGRPYFAAALALSPGEIHISPFDLTENNGAIEEPIRPTIRAAMPVVDASGTKRGIVVLNYRAERLLDRVRSLGSEGRGSVWLVNSESYWLAGPGRETEWGFALPDRVDQTFANAFPAVWDRIRGAPGFGQFVEHDALFSYAPVFAPATSEEGVSIASAPVWYLIAQVPGAVEGAQSLALRSHFAMGLAAALVILAALSLALAHRDALRRQAEDTVRTLSERAERDQDALHSLNREIEAFSYSVSHDLRGPLRGIDGFSKTLLDDYSKSLDETGRGHLTRVRNATQRLGALIDDLVKLLRVGRAEISGVEDADLTAMATVIMDDLQREDPHRDVEFVATSILRARCDPRMLRTVLENLLRNAWKFTGGRKPAVIEFGANTIEGKTAYFVRDNGVGFDMAHAGKLFGAFQRLHAADEYPGTGIGLATVERIIRKHGGRTWAEAEPDAGATIFFTLEGRGAG